MNSIDKLIENLNNEQKEARVLNTKTTLDIERYAGNYKNKKVDIVDAFQSYGKLVTKQMTYTEREDLIKCCIPQSGACGGMYTANTMAIAIEAMGMCLPYNSSNPAASDSKLKECSDVGDIIFNLLENDLKQAERELNDFKNFEFEIISSFSMTSPIDETEFKEGDENENIQSLYSALLKHYNNKTSNKRLEKTLKKIVINKRYTE